MEIQRFYHRILHNSLKNLRDQNKYVNCTKKTVQEVIPIQHSRRYLGSMFTNLRRERKNPLQILRLHSSTTPLDVEKAQAVTKEPHIPVLASEVLEALDVKENGVYLDMTFGAGGHTQMILESHPTVVVYSLDRDPYIKQFADHLQALYPNRFHPMIGKFSDLPELLHERSVNGSFFNGVLMDLGVSSMQFDTPERGFMLSQDGPLDMRMDGKNATDTPTAAEILAHINETALYKVLKYYGNEKNAKRIARAIIESRSHFKSLRTTRELAELVISITGVQERWDSLRRFAHPATKTFQALRILVNDELNQLDYGIRLAHFFLQPMGIIAAISFHSLEDTILKRHFTGYDLDKTPDSIGTKLKKQGRSHLTTYTEEELLDSVHNPWCPLTKHVVTPTEEEAERNTRARSAKLRSARKNLICPY